MDWEIKAVYEVPKEPPAPKVVLELSLAEFTAIYGLFYMTVCGSSALRNTLIGEMHRVQKTLPPPWRDRVAVSKRLVENTNHLRYRNLDRIDEYWEEEQWKSYG